MELRYELSVLIECKDSLNKGSVEAALKSGIFNLENVIGISKVNVNCEEID